VRASATNCFELSSRPREFWVVRSLIPAHPLCWTSFMLAKKAALAIRRDDPLLLQARLEDVFLRPPDRFVAAAIDDLQFGDLLFQQLQRPPLATTLAVRNRPRRSIWLRRLRQRCAFWPRLMNACGPEPPQPFVHRLLASPSTLIDAGIEVRRDLAVAPPFVSLRSVSLQQPACLGELPSRKLYWMALHGNLFRGHKSSPSLNSDLEP
jgi:hypothetical protein